MQSAKKVSATPEELQLKKVGNAKFQMAQELTAGRDFLAAKADADTSAKTVEAIRSNEAVGLENLALEDTARITYRDNRLSSNAGVASKVDSEENSFQAATAILDADLGISSSVSKSQAAAAQAATQVAQAKAKAAQNKNAANAELLGAVAGGAASTYGSWGSTDPLANKNQIAPDYSVAFDANPAKGVTVNPFNTYLSGVTT